MDNSKNNQLIDTFMESKGEYISHKDRWGVEVWGSYIPSNYDTDWNLLLSVVEKIENEIGHAISICQNNCQIYDHDSKSNLEVITFVEKPTKIMSTYNAVLEFINLYIKNK